MNWLSAEGHKLKNVEVVLQMSLFFNAVAVSKHFPYQFVKCSQFISKHLLYVLGTTLHSHPVMWVLHWLLSFSLLAEWTPAVHAVVAGAKLFVHTTFVQGWLGHVWGTQFWGGDLQERRQLSFFLFSEKRLMSGLPVRCGMESSKTLYVVAKLHTYDWIHLGRMSVGLEGAISRVCFVHTYFD